MKKEIKIQFDYLNGPLWKDRLDVKTGKWATGIPSIDNDKAIQVLDSEAGKMYESLYSFGTDDNACSFDDSRFDQMKASLLSLVQTMLSRLAELNDGSFIVVDKATKMLV